MDKFDGFSLDASNSTDLEGRDLNYTYMWTCPGSVLVCAETNSPLLTVTADMRYSGGANDFGQIYNYSVIMKDEYGRQSAKVSAQISITMKETYASCLSLSLV